MKLKEGFKKFIFKTCGKARWNLLAFVFIMVTSFVLDLPSSIFPYTHGSCDAMGNFYYEFDFAGVRRFSMRDDGTFAALSIDPTYGLFAIDNVNTKEQTYCGIATVSDPMAGNSKMFYPTNFVMTDEGEFYGVRYHDNEHDSSIFSAETIVRLSADYKFVDEIFTIDYEDTDRLRYTKMSKFNYYDGHVTFATVEPKGVTLYSIDTKSQAVSVSDLYATDENGTYTAYVIPLDGSFLFIRSDGNVYRTGFNEPLGESIYRFDTSEGTDHPFFRNAVLCGGKLYVATGTGPFTISLLENGDLTKMFEVTGSDYLVKMESYHPDDSSAEAIAVCLENGLYTWSGGEAVREDIVFRPHVTILMHLVSLYGYLMFIPLLGLVINLFIRKKTLLYKQLIITIPVFLILATIVAVSVYNYVDSQKSSSIENDVVMITELATDTLDGYDFSGLLKTDEGTGAAYMDLREKLTKLSTNRSRYWSEGYIFSIIYHPDDGNYYVLSSDEELTMPFEYQLNTDVDLPKTDSDWDSPVYFTDKLGGITGKDAYENNTIAAYGRINDAGGEGSYFVKVEADYSILLSDRSKIWYQIAGYSVLVIGTLLLLLVLSTLNNIRVIKKATSAVKSISEGNLSARVNYKSKDELGQICSQVNEMAISLERSFKEKDRTEKFYYKFVPEKFREYLGKESFTDLTLGDASSRELTVLFCDIRSFSINSEMMTAKENFGFVNTIYGKAGPIIREHNGFVDKYIGDAVMALFEDPDDAVKAGVDLYRAIVLDPETAKELNVSDINIGIGIHTGMAMIGIVGESERLSGTVISDTVNLSSRLESLTKQYKTAILVSKDTVDRLASPDDLKLRYLGMIQVAGVNEVKGVYEVLDCLKEDVKQEREANIIEFREALRLFQLGRRDDAVKALEKIRDEGKGDFVSEMYLKYISSLSPDDKGNIFRFVRK